MHKRIKFYEYKPLIDYNGLHKTGSWNYFVTKCVYLFRIVVARKCEMFVQDARLEIIGILSLQLNIDSTIAFNPKIATLAVSFRTCCIGRNELLIIF